MVIRQYGRIFTLKVKELLLIYDFNYRLLSVLIDNLVAVFHHFSAALLLELFTMEGSSASVTALNTMLKRQRIDQDPDYNEAAPPDLKRLKFLEESGNSLFVVLVYKMFLKI